MAKKRYKVLRVSEHPSLPDCPVRIEKSLLLFDVERMLILLQTEMTNISGQQLLSVFLDIESYDNRHNLLSVMRAVPYLHVNTYPEEAFGTDRVVELSSLRAAEVNVAVSKVAFMDGTVWEPAAKKTDKKRTAADMEKTEEMDLVLPVTEPSAVLKTDIPPEELDHSTENMQGSDIIRDIEAASLLEEEENALRRDRRRRLARYAILVGILVLLGGLGYGGYRYFDNRDTLYASAMQDYADGDYRKALEELQAAGKYRFRDEKETLIRWCTAMSYVELGEYGKSIPLFWENGGFRDSVYNLREIADVYSHVIAAGGAHSVALRTDGTVYAAGRNTEGQCNVAEWNTMAAVAAGENHTVGLRRDGVVVATGDNSQGQCNVLEWSDMKGVAAGKSHTVGLRDNGRAFAVGSNQYGQSEVMEWEDLSAVAAGGYHTVGLKKDGTVVAVGRNDEGQCNVSDWTDIIAVAAGDVNTIGLRADGTVVAAGGNAQGQSAVQDWSGIVAVSAGSNHTAGLKYTGKPLAVGNNDSQQSAVSHFKDAAAIAAGDYHTLCVTYDGGVQAAGSNESGQCEVADWTDVGIPDGLIQMAAY